MSEYRESKFLRSAKVGCGVCLAVLVPIMLLVPCDTVEPIVRLYVCVGSVVAGVVGAIIYATKTK